MRKLILALAALAFLAQNAYSFCGFYVATANAKLFNRGSQVIMVRNGNRTVITMSNDFQGEVKNFAMIVPVPTVLEEKNIRISNQALFDQLDAYSGPRLVEYYDENPCYIREYSYDEAYPSSMAKSAGVEKESNSKKDFDYKVTIEAKYTVGEYDILILSAKESTGLKLWLNKEGYRLPENANEVLDPYIKSNLKFFVVKVNMEKFNATGYQNLRPLQIEYEHSKFMLPIRLGMANSTGFQDLIVYALTNTGRVECTNYRTVKIPTDRNVPLDIRDNFGKFYKALFKRSYKTEGKNAVFLEYAWNVTPSFGGMKCDPCVGPPPITKQLQEAGVNWFDNGAGKVFFTRLHVRYTRDKFPQDLQFQVTPNTEHFQARYILTNPAYGTFDCDAGQTYLRKLAQRRRNEVSQLYALTGWNTEKYKTYIYEYNHMLKNQQDTEDESTGFVPYGDGNNDDFNKKVYTTGLLVAVILLLMLFGYAGKKSALKLNKA